MDTQATSAALRAAPTAASNQVASGRAKELTTIANHQQLSSCAKKTLGAVAAILYAGLFVTSCVIWSTDIGHHADRSFNHLSSCLAIAVILLPLIVAFVVKGLDAWRAARRLRKELLLQALRVEQPTGYEALEEKMLNGSGKYTPEEIATLDHLDKRVNRIFEFRCASKSEEDFDTSLREFPRRNALLYELVKPVGSREADEGYVDRLFRNQMTRDDVKRMNDTEEASSRALDKLVSRLKTMGYRELAAKVTRRETEGYTKRDWTILETLMWKSDWKAEGNTQSLQKAARQLYFYERLQESEGRSSTLAFRFLDLEWDQIPTNYCKASIFALDGEIPKNYFTTLGNMLRQNGQSVLAGRVERLDLYYTPAEWQILRRFAASLLPQEEEE